DLERRNVVADFTALLAQFDDLAVEGKHAFLHIEHRFPHGRARKIGLQQCADDRRIPHRLLRHSRAERAEKLRDGLGAAAGLLDGAAQLCQLHLSKRQQDVFLAWKIVEESSFAYVRGVGDVPDRGLGKALSSKQVEGGTEKALADFHAAALAAGRGELAEVCSPNDPCLLFAGSYLR